MSTSASNAGKHRAAPASKGRASTRVSPARSSSTRPSPARPSQARPSQGRRRAATHAAPRTSSYPLRRSLVTGALAATATGAVVASGVIGDDGSSLTGQTAQAGIAPMVAGADPLLTTDPVGVREETVSRSDSRAEIDSAKLEALSTDQAPGEAFEEKVDNSDPRSIAKALLPEYGYTVEEDYDCLDALYISESGWDMHADNPTSSAYGIPQGLTETHDMPAGYFTSAEVQLRWGLEYINDVYGTPCAAWSFKQGNNWY